MDTATTKKQRGRPPAFDHEEALNKALHVFWTHGYEGASMAELTAAMGINKPSLYGAFGSKEELFRKALERYSAGAIAYVEDALAEPTARKVVETLLTRSAEALTHPVNPKGCMVVQGALTCSRESAAIQQELIERRRQYEAALQQRFARAQAEGDLPTDADPAALAKYVATMHQGMSVQASSGATKEALMAVVAQVLAAWPVG